MHIKSASIRNFGSLKSVDLKFPDTPHIYGIAGGIGVGKTTLVSALTLTPLYRKLSYYSGHVKNMLGGAINIACRSKGAILNLSLERKSEDIDYRASINGVPSGGPGARDYEASIGPYIDDYSVFISTVFGGQGDGFGLLNRESGEASKFFKALLGVDVFQALIKEIKSKISQNKKQEVDHIKASIASYRGRIAELSDCKSMVKSISDSISKQRDIACEMNRNLASIKQLEFEIAEDRSEEVASKLLHLEELGDLLACREFELSKAALSLSRASRSSNAINEKISKINELILINKKSYDFFSQDLASKKIAYATVDTNDPDCAKCPLLLNNLSRPSEELVSVVEEASRLSELLYLLQEMKIKLTYILKDLTSGVNNLRSLRDEAISAKTALERELDIISSVSADNNARVLLSIEDLTNRVEQLKKSVDGSMCNVVDAYDRVAPFEISRLSGAISSMEFALEKAEIKLSELVKSNSANEELSEIYKAVISAMSESISEILPNINKYCIEYSEYVMGGRFYPIVCTDESSGAPTYYIDIFDRNTSSVRSMASWGETTLISEILRVSLSSAIADSYGGSDPSLLVRDEVTGGLGSENKHEYFNLMRYLIKSGRYSQIFIVSHDDEILSQCDCLIEVANGGANLIWQ